MSDRGYIRSPIAGQGFDSPFGNAGFCGGPGGRLGNAILFSQNICFELIKTIGVGSYIGLIISPLSNPEVSYGQLIIDSEITGYVKRILGGIKVDHKRLAVDEIKDVGPLGNFLLTKHTLEYLRKDEHFKPVISNRNMHSLWERQGSLTVNEKAHKESLKILKIHKPSYIDSKKIKEIKKLIKNIKVKHRNNPL